MLGNSSVCFSKYEEPFFKLKAVLSDDTPIQVIQLVWLYLLSEVYELIWAVTLLILLWLTSQVLVDCLPQEK